MNVNIIKSLGEWISMTVWRVMIGFTCYSNYYDFDEALWNYDVLAYDHKRVELWEGDTLLCKNY